MDKKESRFSWKRRDQDVLDDRIIDEEKEEDVLMPFANAVSANAETKKRTPETVPAAPAAPKAPAQAYVPERDKSYISQDVVIDGSISAVNSLVIDGTVNGNVTTDNDATVCGHVEGNITAKSVKFSGAKVKGDIRCTGGVTLGKDTAVTGNVSGKNVEINGCVNGNLTIEETAVLLGSAVINGDISAGLLSVLEGAVIKGNVAVNKTAAPEKKETAPVTAVPEKPKDSAQEDALLKRYI